MSSLVIFIKMIFRQLINHLWLMVNCLKRAMMTLLFRRPYNGNQQQQQHPYHQDIDTGEFVVIERTPRDDSGTFNNNNNNENNKKFPNVMSYTEQDLYNYSNYSLSSAKTSHGIPLSSNTTTVSSINKNDPPPPTPTEPDYFQDMVPEFKKPKTMYIKQYASIDDNVNDLNTDPDSIARKFRVQIDQNHHHHHNQLDDSKFTPFGTMDDNVGQQQQQESEQTWEDMAGDDELWAEADRSLTELRHQRREQRLREHRQQREMRNANNAGNRRQL